MNDECILKEISHKLILNLPDERRLGLLNGKMGMTIFFFTYSLYSKNGFYKKLAEELLDDIYNVIHTVYIYNYNEGLCGIGWGLEYLIQKNFIEEDEEENIFDELDEILLNPDLVKLNQDKYNLKVNDVVYYFISRYCNKNKPLRAEMPYVSLLLSKIEENYSYNNNEIVSSLLENIKYNQVIKFDLSLFLSDIVKTEIINTTGIKRNQDLLIGLDLLLS